MMTNEIIELAEFCDDIEKIYIRICEINDGEYDKLSTVVNKLNDVIGILRTPYANE